MGSSLNGMARKPGLVISGPWCVLCVTS